LVVYYSKLFNGDRLPTLTLHGIILWLSRLLLAVVSSAEIMRSSAICLLTADSREATVVQITRHPLIR